MGVGAWLRIESLKNDRVSDSPAPSVIAAPAAVATTDAAAPAADEQWSIQEASGEITPVGGGSRSITAAERERRYRELLATPPPAPAPPAEKTSLFDRVLAPIANVLAGGKSASAVPPPAPGPSPQRPPAAAVSTQPRAPASEPATSTAVEQDPETDVQPPQLLSVEFVPPQVKDAEETMFIASIVDNRSGVRSVSGVISSPSGSIQGFSAVRDTGNRFVAGVKIPRDAPAGLWTVRYLTLVDNAKNSAHLNQAQGALPPTASFRVVSSSPDETGPQLKSVWLDRVAMRAGERNTVFVQAEDDKAGVSTVSGLFVSPGKAARIGFGCRAGAGGAWECPLSAPACLDCGVWRLDQIQLQDKAGNSATFRSDHAAVNGVMLDLAGAQCDGIPPAITMVSVEPSVVSNAQANTLEVRAIVEDLGPCGVASVSGQAVPPGGVGGQRHPITFRPSGDGATFIGTLNLQHAAVRGQWTITWMQVLDRGNNLRAYSGSDPALARGTFRVE